MGKSKKYTMTHDAFIKGSMLHKEVATEFFAANLQTNILNLIDLSTLQLEKSDFVDSTLGSEVVDILYSVQWSKEIGYITLLLEHQSTPDQLMAFRIQKYMLRFCDEHLTKHPKSKLPCIYPMILYSGQTKYTSTLSFYELFSEPELAKQCFTDPIYLLELRTIKNIDLQNRYHSGIVLSLMREIHKEDMLPYLYTLQPLLQLIGIENLHFLEDLLRYVLDSGKSKSYEPVIKLFAEAVREQDKGNIMSIANEIRREGMQEGIQEGIQQGMLAGIQKGMQESIEKIAKNLLSKNVDIDLIVEVTGLSLQEINGIKKKEASFIS